MPTRHTHWLIQFSSTVTSLVLWHNTFASPKFWKLSSPMAMACPQIFHHIQDKNKKPYLSSNLIQDRLAGKIAQNVLGKSPNISQLFPSYTSGLVLWRIEFPLTDLTSQGTGNGWGWLIQRCLNVFSNDQLSKTLCRAALRSGDTVTSDRIERCCYC